MAAGIQPEGFAWTLAPGERFETPEAVLTFSRAGKNGMSANLHAFVQEHIVRGKTVVRIAEELVISENTVRMHSKRIYAKLDIHKKQDLIDLVDSFDPEPGASRGLLLVRGVA